MGLGLRGELSVLPSGGGDEDDEEDDDEEDVFCVCVVAL